MVRNMVLASSTQAGREHNNGRTSPNPISRGHSKSGQLLQTTYHSDGRNLPKAHRTPPNSLPQHAIRLVLMCRKRRQLSGVHAPPPCPTTGQRHGASHLQVHPPVLHHLPHMGPSPHSTSASLGRREYPWLLQQPKVQTYRGRHVENPYPPSLPGGKRRPTEGSSRGALGHDSGLRSRPTQRTNCRSRQARIPTQSPPTLASLLPMASPPCGCQQPPKPQDGTN